MANWSKQQILFRLRESGTTAARLAEEKGISRFTLYKGLVAPYPRVQDAVSTALGLPKQQIWPDFYDQNGRRKGLITRRSAA